MAQMTLKQLRKLHPGLRIPTKQIGVFKDKVGIALCYLEFDANGEISAAYDFKTGMMHDKEKVVALNSMFYKQSTPDNGICGNEIAHVEQNENSPMYGKVKADKSIACLIKLSMFERDIHWYTEDEGVWVVSVDPEKDFSLRTIVKMQDKINDYERKFKKEQDVQNQNQDEITC